MKTPPLYTPLDIYIPRFPWFYESSLSSLLERYYENENGEYVEEMYDAFWKNRTKEEVYNSIWAAYFELFVGEYNHRLESIGIQLWIKSRVVSPRYHNYGSDELEVEVFYNLENVVAWLTSYDIIIKWQEYLAKENTSRDGFSAFWENTLKGFLTKVKARESIEPFELTQIIDFYISLLEEDEDEDFYETIIGELYTDFIL